MNQSAKHHALQSRTQRFAPGYGSGLGEISSQHAYADARLDVTTALNSLLHISGKTVPFCAGQHLDAAVISLRKAIEVLDEFKDEER